MHHGMPPEGEASVGLRFSKRSPLTSALDVGTVLALEADQDIAIAANAKLRPIRLK